MRLTIKGQVTIPLPIRKRLGLQAHSSVSFLEENGRIYIQKQQDQDAPSFSFAQARGVATAGLSTEDILKLTRSEE